MAIGGSREDFARLGIYIDANGAISTSKQLTGELNKLGTAGDRVSNVVSIKTAPSFKAVETTAKSAHIATGRLGNQFGSLTSQLTGLHPVVSNVASVLGNFAIGSGLTLGIIAGVTAITVLWDTYTKATREAKKANDELVKSLNDQNFRAALGPEPDLVLATNAQRNTLMQQRERRRQLKNFGVSDDDDRIKTLDVQILHSQTQLIAGETLLVEARMAAGKPLETVVTKARDIAAETEKAARAAERYRSLMQSIYGSDLSLLNGETSAQMAGRLRMERDPNSLENRGNAYTRGRILDDEIKAQATGYSMPNVNLNDGLTKKQLAAQEKMLTADERHAQRIEGAIVNSANIIGSAVMQALNVGGGGKGSQIGGMIGAGIGGVLGSMAGPAGSVVASGVGQVLGSVVGGLAGSLLGGLFDGHKDAINTNTAAVRQLTQAMLLNAPSGYKTGRGRFDATDVKDFQRATTRYRSRGGAPVMVVA